MNKNYRITNKQPSYSNYGFSLNPFDYFDVPNLLEYLPLTVKESVGLEGYATEQKLKEILDGKSDNYEVLSKPLYTTRNIFQIWSISFYSLIQQTNFYTKKEQEKIEKFANLLKAYSINEPENVTNSKLLKETNAYIFSLANFLLPTEEQTIKNIYDKCREQINLDGTINPLGKQEEIKYEENRSLLFQLKLKRGLSIGIPFFMVVGGMYLWQRKRK